MTITFDPAAHLYRVDGNPVPSVTQLVAPLGADYDEPDELAELAIDAAADRGAALHAYLAHRLQGGAEEDFELPGSYAPYVDAVELFLAEHRIEPLAIETPLACARYAGTPDLICEFDGANAILDYKFVSRVAKSKVGAQLAGYLYLCDQAEIPVDALFAVQFLSSGDYRLYPVNLFRAMEAFDACLAVYDIKTKAHPRGRIF